MRVRTVRPRFYSRVYSAAISYKLSYLRRTFPSSTRMQSAVRSNITTYRNDVNVTRGIIFSLRVFTLNNQHAILKHFFILGIFILTFFLRPLIYTVLIRTAARARHHAR